MERFLEGYAGEKFDLVVVGGGITGAAVAYDASSRGLSVAMVEKNDYGWATSAATSKLIHGGLRYLQNLEFGLVRESLRERRIMENIAPNLVYPIEFLVPSYNDSRRNKWILRAGLILYDIFSYDRKKTWDKSRRILHHKWLTREAVIRMEPEVRTRGLTGGSIYYDCQSINSERLTLAFIKSALRNGARTANHARLVEFLFDGPGKVTGVRVEDTLTGKSVDISSKLVINCGGPWADIILNLADRSGRSKHRITRSEGIHILTRKFETRHAVVMWTPAGRHFFTIPWRGLQLIGTTDREYVGNPDKYRVSRESIEGLIKDTNDSIGDGSLTYDDVVFAYGGLRPLVDKETEGTYESSRKYEIYDNASDGFDGLITVEGGKYTTSRHLAESVLDTVEKKLGRQARGPMTDRRYLAACEITDTAAFMADLKSAYTDFDEATVAFMGCNYGTEAAAVLDLARQNADLARVVTPDGQILASVVYAVRKESAATLPDILFRRTAIGTIGHPGQDVLEAAGRIAAAELNWDRKRLEAELNAAADQMALP